MKLRKPRDQDARRILIYGPPGVGKTTLAADAPSPIVLPVEDGLGDLDVASLERPATWSEVIEAIASVATEEHEYRTLVIDSLTALEGLAHAHMMSRDRRRPESIDQWEGGYNKWRQSALDFAWRPLQRACDRVIDRGISVVMIAHSVVRAHKDPESEGWDEHSPQLEPLAAGAMIQWSDDVLFARFEEARVTDTSGHTKGQSTGRRVLHTEHSATAVAKSRRALPRTIVMDRDRPWAALGAALAAPTPTGDVRAEIEGLLATRPILRTRVEQAIAKGGDVHKIRDSLKGA